MTKINSNLNAAKSAKRDEFYTQLTDIEKELSHYTHHFKDKVIFCNCDDPEESNFWLYFSLNFKRLGLRKLISTHYEIDKPSYKLELQVKEGELSTTKTPLKQNGDFRSPECVAILKESDIVVTNPPFSLFREYVAQLMEHEKKFLIVGSQNAITYKEIFPLIMQNKVWAGVDNGGTKWFKVPNDYDINTKTSIKVIDGNKYFSMGSIYWYTNLDIKKRHEDIILYRTYKSNEASYPTYDNYEAIEVSKTKDIPCDYEGAMGVPITFLDKFNPDQFEIIGASESEGKGFSNGLWKKESKVAQPLVHGERKFKRIFIKVK